MHRKPTPVADGMPYALLALVSSLAVLWIIRHPLATALVADFRWIGHAFAWLWTEVHPHAEFGRTGFVAFGDRNPLFDWSMGPYGANWGMFGHRIGFGSYGSWVPFMSPNGGRYVDFFGHSYGFELWGHVGPFSEVTS